LSVEGVHEIPNAVSLTEPATRELGDPGGVVSADGDEVGPEWPATDPPPDAELPVFDELPVAAVEAVDPEEPTAPPPLLPEDAAVEADEPPPLLDPPPLPELPELATAGPESGGTGRTPAGMSAAAGALLLRRPK
jgi:hypothetical protein